jgi:hypothetical protein
MPDGTAALSPAFGAQASVATAVLIVLNRVVPPPPNADPFVLNEMGLMMLALALTAITSATPTIEAV